MTETKKLVAKYFDFSTRDAVNAQYLEGDFFVPKYQSSLEDLLNEVEVENTSDLRDEVKDLTKEVEGLENSLAGKDEEISDLEKEIERLEGQLDMAKA